jgi:hypothetical protein
MKYASADSRANDGKHGDEPQEFFISRHGGA